MMFSARSMTSVLTATALVFGATIGSAQASPLALGKSAGVAFESDVSLVRDGCGPGWRFSHRRGECVPDHGPRHNGPQHFHGSHHDGHPGHRRGSHRDHRDDRKDRNTAAAVAAGAVVLGIIAASAANKNKNNGQVKSNNGNPKFKKQQ